MGKFKSEDADHTYNELPEYNDEDEEEEDVKQEFDVKHDPEYKPKTIKFQKKNHRSRHVYSFIDSYAIAHAGDTILTVKNWYLGRRVRYSVLYV